MEKYIQIPTTDSFVISGILNSHKKTDKLIIFIHGLTGDSSEAHYYLGQKYFTERWYDVFRFRFYHKYKNTRNLHETSIQEHGVDVEAVINNFEGEYSEIILITHSLWGPSVLRANNIPNQVKMIIHWDPAFDTSTALSKCFQKQSDIFYMNSGKNIQISHKIYDELIENPWMKLLKESDKNHYIIFAGKNNKIDFKSQIDALSIESCIIEWANHWFTQEWKYEELFEKTLEYINK